MTDRTEYSEDPYEDGTVPADADLATSGRDGATDEGDDLVGATGDGERNPDALVEGNRVATAEDME